MGITDKLRARLKQHWFRLDSSNMQELRDEWVEALYEIEEAERRLRDLSEAANKRADRDSARIAELEAELARRDAAFSKISELLAVACSTGYDRRDDILKKASALLKAAKAAGFSDEIVAAVALDAGVELAK